MSEFTKRKTIVEYLDDYLGINTVSDDSQNGLQVEGSDRVRKIAFAVDACMQTIRGAARFGADMLIVHHGLLWSRNERIVGVMKKRMAVLMANGVSLYAVHLPLDCHGEVGNNVELARILGLEVQAKFARYHGVEIGVLATPGEPLPREELIGTLEKSLHTKVSLLPFGPRKVKKVGIVSGGGASLAAEASDRGCDTFITGETSHSGYHIAKESRLNMIFAGHYASETVGLKALGRHLEKKFPIEYKFVSAPTGL